MQVEDRASDFTPQGLATTMSSYAAIWATSAPPPGVFAALADQARHKMHQFTPQGIAMTARACAAVGYAEEGLLTVLGREACERVELFTPQGLAMMIRAWAVLQQPCGDLVEAISRASSRQVKARAANSPFPACPPPLSGNCRELPIPCVQLPVTWSRLSKLFPSHVCVNFVADVALLLPICSATETPPGTQIQPPRHRQHCLGLLAPWV